MKNWQLPFNMVLGTFLIVGLQSCDKECTDACKPQCENYDPCCPVKGADATFQIMQRPEKPDGGMKSLEIKPYPIGEAVYGYTRLEMQAQEGFSNYQYYFIRDGELLNRPNIQDGKPSYTFNTGNTAEAYDLRIRLEVYQEDAKTCGKDTFAVQEQVIRVLPFGKNPIFGKYIGNYEPPFAKNEDFEIHIQKADYLDLVDTLFYMDHIKEPFLLPQDCEGLHSRVTGKRFAFYSDYFCCRRAAALGKLLEPNKIEVIVNERDAEPCESERTDPRIEKTFIGTRVP